MNHDEDSELVRITRQLQKYNPEWTVIIPDLKTCRFERDDFDRTVLELKFSSSEGFYGELQCDKDRSSIVIHSKESAAAIYHGVFYSSSDVHSYAFIRDYMKEIALQQFQIVLKERELEKTKGSSDQIGAVQRFWSK